MAMAKITIEFSNPNKPTEVYDVNNYVMVYGNDDDNLPSGIAGKCSVIFESLALTHLMQGTFARIGKNIK